MTANVHACMCARIHTYIHAYVHTHMPTYIPAPQSVLKTIALYSRLRRAVLAARFASNKRGKHFQEGGSGCVYLGEKDMHVLRMNRLCNLVPFDCLRHYCMSLLEQPSPAAGWIFVLW